MLFFIDKDNSNIDIYRNWQRPTSENNCMSDILILIQKNIRYQFLS